MKPIARTTIVLTVLAVSFTPARAEQHIRVATFNIANFGDTKEYERSLISLVNIIRAANADLIAVQEVATDQFGEDQVERLTKLLNKAASFYGTKHYDFAVSDVHTGDETTAFLWRSPVTLESGITLLQHEADPDNDGKPAFQRVPTVATFRAGNYDFHVVNCHLYTDKGDTSEGRATEYDELVKWLKALASKTEKDAVVLGDFNRFLNGKKWSHLMVSNHATHFRFPLLEAIKAAKPSFDPAADEAPGDEFSTTTAKKKSIYDQILISAGSYNEFTASPVLGEHVGIVVFDNDPAFEWFIASWTNVIKMLTDHRPVWIRLRTDKPDDD